MGQRHAQHEQSMTTTFRWWRDKGAVIDRHIERLNRYAQDRITELTQEGFTSGELWVMIGKIEYRGWWEVKGGAQ